MESENNKHTLTDGVGGVLPVVAVKFAGAVVTEAAAAAWLKVSHPDRKINPVSSSVEK